MDDIVLGDDMVIPAVVLAQDRSVLAGDQAAEAFQGGIEGYDGIGLFQYFSDLFAFDILAIAHHSAEEAALADGADHFSALEDGQVLYIVFLHQFEGFGNGLSGFYRDQSFSAPSCDDVFEGLYVQEASFHHPLVVVYLSYVAAAVVVEDHHYQVVLFQEVF